MGKHKSSPKNEFLKVFGVKKKYIQSLKHGKFEFPFYGKIMGEDKHSKVMDFLNILGETEIYTNFKDMEQDNFHITGKVWEHEKHTQIAGIFQGKQEYICNLQIMENMNSRFMGKK